MKTELPFTLMVKPAGSACNMRCAYCYYIDNPSGGHTFMSEETLEKVIRDYCESSPGPVLSFVWHGGEPTLAGLDFYRKAMRFQKAFLPQGYECWNNLQTNGLALNEEWCAFLKANHFDVGISIDGTKALHDHYRADASGSPTYERIRKNIALLQKHGIQPDLLCTVNAETVKNPIRVYENMKSFRTGWIQFIPVVNHTGSGSVSSDSVTPEAYGEFLCALFRQWVLKDFGKTNVQMFAELLNVYHGGIPGVCWMSETCGRALIAESDGNIYSCDHFVNKDHLIGNIASMSFAEAVDSNLQRSFGQSKKNALSETCKECPWLSICHGGCLKDRIRENNENHLCEGLKRFYEYGDPVFRRISELLHQRVRADEIRQIIRKEKLL
jgi:uncharacterized protein